MSGVNNKPRQNGKPNGNAALPTNLSVNIGAAPKPNNKPNGNKGNKNTFTNPLFTANVRKYNPINNLFVNKKITKNMKNNCPYGYVIPKSMVKNNPNMQVLLSNAGYVNRNNHFVHPSAKNRPLFKANTPQNNNTECVKLIAEYKSLLQRMKDSKCKMNNL